LPVYGSVTEEATANATLRAIDYAVVKDIAFIVVQVGFWCLVIAAWMRVGRARAQFLPGRQWLSRASLAFASLALLFTTAMTIYVRVGQRIPYDKWESLYLLTTPIVSLLGIVLASLGKAAPRLVGLSTSIFTFFIALADAATL
jgi:hypothetical protein